MREAYEPEVNALLQHGQHGKLDLAITLLKEADKMDKKLNWRELLKLALVLLVPERKELKSFKTAEDFLNLEMPPLGMRFVTLQLKESINREFRQRYPKWTPTIRVSSIALLEKCVGKGLGIGLSVSVPGAKHREGIRVLPLKKLDPVRLGVVWREQQDAFRKRVLEELLSEIEETAKPLRIRVHRSTR